jgi:uncharacterized protein YndB with AHSA1/START domain
MADLPIYVLDHVFAAPRVLVWKSWTDPNLLRRWYGPNVETIIHKFDLRVGGEWLNEMKWGSNSDFSKMSFHEVVPLQKLVWHLIDRFSMEHHYQPHDARLAANTFNNCDV